MVTKLVTTTMALGRSSGGGRRRHRGRRWRLPARGGERTEVVLAVHRGQAGEQVADIDLRVVPMPEAGDDDRVEDGGALAGVGVADEEPVLLPKRGGADVVLDDVGVEPGLAVAQVRGQAFPLRKQITELLGNKLAPGRGSAPRTTVSETAVLLLHQPGMVREAGFAPATVVM